MEKWKDAALPFKERARILTRKMTMEEKLNQMLCQSPVIPRLGIAPHTWCSLSPTTTENSFPQPVAMAASFNTELTQKAAHAISVQTRAVYDHAMQSDNDKEYKPLPIVSIPTGIFCSQAKGYRTLGEDPYLAAKISKAFFDGLQANNEKYAKVIPTVESSAIHGQIIEKQLDKTHLLPLESYLGTAGIYLSSENSENIQQIRKLLYGKLKLNGFLMCRGKSISPDTNNQCHMYLNAAFEDLQAAFKQGTLSRETINDAVYRIILAKMRLGIFEGDDPTAPLHIGTDSQEHNEINRQIAAESIVLLKNDNLLPLSTENVKKIAVIGPNADNKNIMPQDKTRSKCTTVLDGLGKVHGKVAITYAQGSDSHADANENETLQAEAAWAAEQADVVILAVGRDFPSNDANNVQSFSRPEFQDELIEAVCGVGKPTILLNFSGFGTDLTKADELCDAVLQCWYPGIYGGEVIDEILFGQRQPCGKLPITFFKDADSLVNSADDCTEDKTYRYFNGTALYPFGYGLSYSHIEYYRIYLSAAKIKAGEDISVIVFLKNKGKYDTKDIVQAYLVDEQTSATAPIRRLAAFKKVTLPVEKEVKVSLTIKADSMALAKEDDSSAIEPGRFSIYVGAGQPDNVTADLYNRDCLHIGFLVE